MNRRDFLKTGAVGAAALLSGIPGQAVISVAEMLPPSLAADIIKSPVLTRLLAELAGKYGGGVEIESDPSDPDYIRPKKKPKTPLADLAHVVVETIITFKRDTATDEQRHQAKLQLLRQLADAGMEIGKMVRRNALQYDEFKTLVHEWQRNPDSNQETRALSKIIQSLAKEQRYEYAVAERILQEGLAKGEILRNSNPVVDAMAQEGGPDILDEFWNLVLQSGEPKSYSFKNFLDISDLSELREAYYCCFDQAMEGLDSHAMIAARLAGTGKETHYTDHPLEIGIEILKDVIRNISADSPTATQIMGVFWDPRERFSDIIGEISHAVTSKLDQLRKKDPLLKAKLGKRYDRKEFTADLKGIFSTDYETLQNAFDQSFYQEVPLDKAMPEMPHYDDDAMYIQEAKARSSNRLLRQEAWSDRVKNRPKPSLGRASD